MRDIASPLDGFASPFGVPVRFYPANVFGDGSNGLLWDYSATTGLYSDNLGATPLTVPDTGVGLVADRSRVRSPVTAYGGAQASAGLRPKWGRAPVSRRNLLTYTQQFDNAAWATSNATKTTGVTDPNGGSLAVTVTATAAYGYMRQVVTSPVGTPTLTNGLWMRRRTGTGAVTLYRPDAATGINVASSIGSSWTFLSLSGAAGASVSYIRVELTVSGDAVDVAFPQLELGSTATAYQSVTSTYDMTEAGVPSYGYIRPDRTDDVLSTVLTLAQTGDVAVFGRNGSWLETARVYSAGATFSIGPTTVTGLTAGLLAALGDIVGIVAIGRTLTAAELASTLAYFKARGAAGWLTAGAEMLTNGDFASDTVWTKGTGWTIAAGAATKVAGVASVLAQAVAPTALVVYQLDFTVTRTAGTVTPRFTGGTTVSGAAVSASGTYRQLLVAASGNTAVDFSADATFAGTIDNVSLKPLVAA